MKNYDVTVVARPTLSEQELSDLVLKLEQVLSEHATQIEKHESVINQQLAYPIDHHSTGHFVRMSIGSTEPFDLSRVLADATKGNDNILRWSAIGARAEKPAKTRTKSVIDQLREHGDVRPANVAQAPQTQDSPGETPIPTQIDEAEIDKKLEELLQ